MDGARAGAAPAAGEAAGGGAAQGPRTAAASRAVVARINAVLLAERFGRRGAARTLTPLQRVADQPAAIPLAKEPADWRPVVSEAAVSATLASRLARAGATIATSAAPADEAEIAPVEPRGQADTDGTSSSVDDLRERPATAPDSMSDAAPEVAASRSPVVPPRPSPQANPNHVDHPPRETERPGGLVLPAVQRAAATASPFDLRPGEKTLRFEMPPPEAPGLAAGRADRVADRLTDSPTHSGGPSNAILGRTGPAASPSEATAVPETGSAPETGSKWPRYAALARRIFRYALIALAVWFVVSLVAIAVFRFVDPPGSTLMFGQKITGTRVIQRWVPFERISPQLVRAVVVSEDGRFCRHWGIDPKEIVAAIERARNGIPRGASTITMQVAKNLFLWPSKSYLRKALEVPLTLAIEALWPKRRIIEVYLNIAEWAPGIFGAEAAARHHFGKAAASLSRREAALLAVALPNPLERNAGKPGAGMQRLGRLIERRIANSPEAVGCLLP